MEALKSLVLLDLYLSIWVSPQVLCKILVFVTKLYVGRAEASFEASPQADPIARFAPASPDRPQD
ncbi:hypothetical protein [Tychonema sp. LEGE 07203]|uniref:hypothetical protein n=1 Tax=Tychonema sp. LEGE 07203 TaxID=1828671 RepID=UPI00187E4E0F|nr:hypothetical protein [Tychonema sp. LEGE 07203]MBE9093339.1 hypothetical protein [Tychonema sp. LEGE 07203]